MDHLDYLPLFVYGTLKPGGGSYTTYLARRTLTEYGATLQPAALYTDGLYPYLVVDPPGVEPDDRVYGVLVVIREDCFVETLSRLDWYEDYRPISPWSLYLRVRRVVETPAGPAEAWIYVAGPATAAGIEAGRLTKIEAGTWPVSAPP